LLAIQVHKNLKKFPTITYTLTMLIFTMKEKYFEEESKTTTETPSQVTVIHTVHLTMTKIINCRSWASDWTC